MNEPFSLADWQHLFHKAILSVNAPSPKVLRRLGIQGTENASALARIGIYRRGVFARLENVIVSDFRLTARAMGKKRILELFREFYRKKGAGKEGPLFTELEITFSKFLLRHGGLNTKTKVLLDRDLAYLRARFAPAHPSQNPLPFPFTFHPSVSLIPSGRRQGIIVLWRNPSHWTEEKRLNGKNAIAMHALFRFKPDRTSIAGLFPSRDWTEKSVRKFIQLWTLKGVFIPS